MFDRDSPFVESGAPGPASRNVVALQRLRRAFAACEIAPGATFSEADAARRFGLGRAAVRVALTALAASGFVDRRPRQGWRATAVDGARIGEILVARRRLEPVLTEVRLEAGEILALHSLARISAVAASAGDRRALSTARAADRQIADTLARGSGAMVARWLGEAWDHAARVAHLLDAAGHVLWPTDRGPLILALQTGDVAAALDAVERDIANFEAAALRALVSAANPFGAQLSARSARRWKSNGAKQQAKSFSHTREIGP